MRINAPKTYTAYRAWLILFMQQLEQDLPPASIDAILAYIQCADRFDGTPQHNNPEWFEAPCRGGFLNDIPGVVSESLATIHLAKIYGLDSIQIVQSKDFQFAQKIDFIVHLPDGRTITVQSKTGCFKGNSIFVEPDWVEGFADLVTITDIDDRETYVVDRIKLIPYSGKYIHARDLVKMAAHCFNNRQLMKGLE